MSDQWQLRHVPTPIAATRLWQRGKGLGSVGFGLCSGRLPLQDRAPSASLVPSLPRGLTGPVPGPTRYKSGSLSRRKVKVLVSLVYLHHSWLYPSQWYPSGVVSQSVRSPSSIDSCAFAFVHSPLSFAAVHLFSGQVAMSTNVNSASTTDGPVTKGRTTVVDGGLFVSFLICLFVGLF